VPCEAAVEVEAEVGTDAGAIAGTPFALVASATVVTAVTPLGGLVRSSGEVLPGYSFTCM
jgi:hypothetical protein